MKISYIAPEMAVIAYLLSKSETEELFRKRLDELVKADDFDDVVKHISSIPASARFALFSMQKTEDTLSLTEALLLLSATDRMYSNARDVVVARDSIFFNAAVARLFEFTVNGKEEPDEFDIAKKISKEGLLGVAGDFDFNGIQLTEVTGESEEDKRLFVLSGSLYRETWSMLERIGISTSSIIPIADIDKAGQRIPGFCYLFFPGVVALSEMAQSTSATLPRRVTEDLSRLPFKDDGRDETD